MNVKPPNAWYAQFFQLIPNNRRRVQWNGKPGIDRRFYWRLSKYDRVVTVLDFLHMNHWLISRA